MQHGVPDRTSRRVGLLLGLGLVLGTWGWSALEPAWDVDRFTHAFYYMWYGTPTWDGSWIHWNERRHRPPDDLASNYYPLLGPYSSKDPTVQRYHLQWLRDAGIGTIVISYWSPQDPDPAALDQLAVLSRQYGLRWSFILEPYRGLDRDRFIRDVMWLTDRYGDLLFQWPFPTAAFPWTRLRPVFYVFHPGALAVQDWIYIFHFFHRRDRAAVFLMNDISGVTLTWGADGVYTYTPAPAGFNEQIHPALRQRARAARSLFVATVAPGFINTEVRPDLAFLTTPRRQGQHYDQSWSLALQLDPDWIAIISFNEWHEGTQIEPARPMPETRYQDYQDLPDLPPAVAPYGYLMKTRAWVERWRNQRWNMRANLD